MKLIIDIPEEIKAVIDKNGTNEIVAETLWQAVKNGTPLDDLRAEIGRCKTRHEMQLSERDTKGKLMISDIFCHIIEIIDGYTTDKAEREEKE